MQRLTFYYVKKRFEEAGYVLLSNRYYNSKRKLRYICSNGHECEITYSDFSQGKGCKICGHKRKGKSRMKDYDEIKKSFESEGYILLSKSYKNNEHKLNYMCPSGHINSISWHNWNAGYRCPTCYHIRRSIAQTGPLSHFWRGGVSCDPYCDAWADTEYKESIRERDGHRCLNPCCSDNKDDLTIHHIDYNKKNCKPTNLITLCRSCNSSANFDRDWHKAWYTAILKRRN